MEVRGAAYKAGEYWFGMGGHWRRDNTVSTTNDTHTHTHASGEIYARAHLGHPLRVESVRHFQRHFDEHKIALTTDRLPYKTTYMLPILELRKIKRIPYKHPRGAITIVRFRPLSGLPDGSAEAQR